MSKNDELDKSEDIKNGTYRMKKYNSCSFQFYIIKIIYIIYNIFYVAYINICNNLHIT
jgi:hypothetical protein